MVCRVAACLYDAGTACTACAYGWRVHALAECKFINKFANNEINRADNLIFSGFYAFRMSAEVCPRCGMVCADRWHAACCVGFLCIFMHDTARGERGQSSTLRGCRRSRNMSECVLRRHNAEADSPVFRFRRATDTFSRAEKPFRVRRRAFSVVRKSLFRTMKEPVRQSRKNALAVREKPTCCMPELCAVA